MARYNPKDVEPKWRKAWADADVYRADNASTTVPTPTSVA